MLSWPNKDPDEVLDFSINWADDDAPVLQDGETIEDSEFFVDSGDVTIESSSELNGVTTAWLSGGVVGEVNVVTNRITTSAGRTYDQSVRLRIRAH